MGATTIEQALRTDTRGTIRGDGGFMELIVAQRGWPAGTDLAGILANEVAAEYAIATTDGRHAQLDEWHEGETREQVYAERYTAAGRTWHGWVDADTRKVVQTG